MNLLLGLLLLAAPPGPTSTSTQANSELGHDIVEAANDIFAGKAAIGAERLRLLQKKHPDPGRMVVLLATAELLRGSRRAELLLRDSGEAPALLAMALSRGSSGLARAQQVLARASRDKRPDPMSKFLAALAWSKAGQNEKAHQSLKAALREADGALDPVFAPDPFYFLVQGVRQSIRGLMDSPTVDLQLAELMLKHNRRHGALQLADGLIKNPRYKDAAHFLKAKAWLRIDPREAERQARQSKKSDARVIEAEAMIARGAPSAEVRRRLQAMDSVSEAYRGRAAVVVARVLLAEGETSGAVDAARQAYRAAPEDPQALAVYAKALLAVGDPGRAQAMAERLMKKLPLEPNPFRLMAQIKKARGQTRELATIELRAQAHDKAVTQLRAERARVEEVFSAVRDADAARDVAGLDPLVGRHPQAALAVDLALARHGQPGTRAVARERILARCRRALPKLLRHRIGWETSYVPIRIYGVATTASVVLSAADPARCGADTLRMGQ